MGEIADDVSCARSDLSDALALAQAHIMAGGMDGNGWLAELARLYGEVAELELLVQAAERKAAA